MKLEEARWAKVWFVYDLYPPYPQYPDLYKRLLCCTSGLTVSYKVYGITDGTLMAI